jgi:formylmethanofuran dehydrogenase subunit E
MANRVRERVPCPSCEELITFVDRVQIDDKITCPHCRVDLVVVEVNPIELDWDDKG